MSGQIAKLKEELNTDPLGIGYNDMSDIQIVDSMNDPIISVDRKLIPTEEVLEAIESAALTALTSDKSARVWGVLAMKEIDPFGVAAAILIDAFGKTSLTIDALKLLRKHNVSRAQVLEYPGKVKEGHVQMAYGNIASTIKASGPPGPNKLEG